MTRTFSFEGAGFFGIRRIYDKPVSVFYVDTAGKGRVYMSQACYLDSEDSRRIVIVDSIKFLSLWREDPSGYQREFSDGNPEVWKNDYKYSKAAQGFSYGLENPVPLAQVSCWYYVSQLRQSLLARIIMFCSRGKRRQLQEQVPYVVVGDGITRTIWLLTQGVKAFPVLCPEGHANLLLECAGVEGSRSFTARELMLHNMRLGCSNGRARALMR